jgi:hypothetical protein
MQFCRRLPLAGANPLWPLAARKVEGLYREFRAIAGILAGTARPRWPLPLQHDKQCRRTALKRAGVAGLGLDLMRGLHNRTR